jgi:hypothetical protein
MSHKNNPSEKVQVQAAQIQTNRLQTVQVFNIYTSLGYKYSKRVRALLHPQQTIVAGWRYNKLQIL